MATQHCLILASASRARARMVRAAGVSVEIEPADVDEADIKAACRAAGDDARGTASRLAAAKALAVASRHPRSLVIGSDQVLALDDAWFDKPQDTEEAQDALRALRGRTHALVSAVAVARADAVEWSAVDEARLTMRDFSDAFLADYLAKMGRDVCDTVGGYRLEGLGIQLFSRLEGDFFVILGMPLMPLLAYLRSRGLVPT
jgi:septum formation protein